jgi:hypothetical protein
LLPQGQGTGQSTVVLTDEEIARLAAASAVQGVTQTQYGINDITYQVSLNEPKLLVENEVYFPGWRATLAMQDGVHLIDATATNGVFRSWSLPAGNYTMVASFAFPHILALRAICAGSFLVYGGLWLAWRRRDRLDRP